MSKNIKRAIGIGCLLFALILTQIPVGNVNAANGINDFHMDRSTLCKYEGSSSFISTPKNVKVIGEEAFARNSEIYDVTVKKPVKEIRFSAFAACPALSTVRLPDSLETLDHYVFSGCQNLKQVNLGPGVKNLGNGVFAGCQSLKNVAVDSANPYFVCSKGALYDDKKEILYGYLNGYESRTYKMPNSVTEIRPYSFWGNTTLNSVQLSSYLEEIPGYAFSFCRGLEEVVIPYSVNTIGAKAFENCYSLTRVVIPPSVNYIHPSAFDGCPQLEIVAKEGTAGAEFYRMFQKKLEETPAEERYEGSGEMQEDSVSGNTVNPPAVSSVDASKDPSNVEYMPDRDVLEIPESDDVKSKSLVIGGSAMMFLDSKGVTVYENQKKPSGTNDSVIEIPDEKVTVVTSTGSVLPEYVEDSMNDEKIEMKRSGSPNKDDSPDTGDSSIPVNWILAAGVAALGVLILLISHDFKKNE